MAPPLKEDPPGAGFWVAAPPCSWAVPRGTTPLPEGAASGAGAGAAPTQWQKEHESNVTMKYKLPA